VYLVRRGHYRSYDKDGDLTIRSSVGENPMLHTNLYVLPSWIYGRSKFYIAGIDLFAPVTLTLTR